jgi:hypothetical protein
MSKVAEQASYIAGVALENAINSVDSAEVQIAVAEMLVVLGSNFLRAVTGEDHTRQFLQSGIDQLDHPAVLNVIQIEEHEAETKH